MRKGRTEYGYESQREQRKEKRKQKKIYSEKNLHIQRSEKVVKLAYSKKEKRLEDRKDDKGGQSTGREMEEGGG